MFFPSPSTWKMVKDAPNHVPMNMIGLAQTSREILEDGDIPIFPVVLITPNSQGAPKGNMPVLSWYHIIHLLRGG